MPRLLVLTELAVFTLELQQKQLAPWVADQSVWHSLAERRKRLHAAPGTQ